MERVASLKYSHAKKNEHMNVGPKLSELEFKDHVYIVQQDAHQ